MLNLRCWPHFCQDPSWFVLRVGGKAIGTFRITSLKVSQHRSCQDRLHLSAVFFSVETEPGLWYLICVGFFLCVKCPLEAVTSLLGVIVCTGTVLQLIPILLIVCTPPHPPTHPGRPLSAQKCTITVCSRGVSPPLLMLCLWVCSRALGVCI